MLMISIEKIKYTEINKSFPFWPLVRDEQTFELVLNCVKGNEGIEGKFPYEIMEDFRPGSFCLCGSLGWVGWKESRTEF